MPQLYSNSTLYTEIMLFLLALYHLERQNSCFLFSTALIEIQMFLKVLVQTPKNTSRYHVLTRAGVDGILPTINVMIVSVLSVYLLPIPFTYFQSPGSNWIFSNKKI